MIPSDEEESISSIGSDLLSHAQEFGEPNRLPVTTQLFPFLLLASRRMTTREMSDWLEKTKNVKLSAPMISKGLKRPELHLNRIAEHIHPLASYIVAVYHHMGVSVEALLFGKNPQTSVTVFDEVYEVASHDPDGISEGVREAFQEIEDLWAQMPQEVKFMCRPYFNFEEKPTEESSKDEPNQQSPHQP